MGSSGDHWIIGCEVLEKELYLDFVLPTSPAEERPLAEEVRPPFPVCKASCCYIVLETFCNSNGVCNWSWQQCPSPPSRIS